MNLSKREMLRASVSVGMVAFVLQGSAQAAGAPTPAPYTGLKKTIAVDTFLAAEAVGGTVTADGMTAMLIDALANDGRFIVVERGGGSDASGAITASAIVRGAVTKYEANAGGSSLGIGGPMGGMLAGRAGLKSQKALMEISLRLVDASTGQVISTSKAQGTASSSGADAGVVNPFSGATAGGSTFHNTPIGQAGADAIVKAVEMIAASMRAVPWSAQVVEADGGRVYVNAGADRNVQAGTVLTVYRQGKVFTDPSTGLVLDVDLQRLGTVRIDSVRERLSTATVISGDPPARGDLLKLE